MSVDDMASLLRRSGLRVESTQHDAIALGSPAGIPMIAQMIDCVGGRRCTAVRFLGVLPIGDSAAAIDRARRFEWNVPIAHVSMVPQDDFVVLMIGRHVFLSGGVTTGNIAQNALFTALLIVNMRDDLLVADPGLAQLWGMNE